MPAARAPRLPTSAGMSVTQVLQIHHYHLHGIARLNRTPASNRRSWLNGLEPWQAGLVMLVGFAVVLWLIALGFVEARDELVLVLLTMTSINFGTGAGRLARASPLCVVRRRVAPAPRGVRGGHRGERRPAPGLFAARCSLARPPVRGQAPDQHRAQRAHGLQRPCAPARTTAGSSCSRGPGTMMDRGLVAEGAARAKKLSVMTSVHEPVHVVVSQAW
jgi:hypothetical protein